MMHRHAVRLSTALIAAIALALGLAAANVWAAGPGVSLEDASAGLGDNAMVDLDASDIGSPGLGAWSIDIIYDPTVITAVNCENGEDQIAVCNPEFADDTVRVAGASATGVEGDVHLATITFECGNDAGDSPLTIRLRDFMDATPLNLRPIDASLNHGSVTCGEAPVLPAAGSHGSTDNGLLVALAGLLAAAGLAFAGRGLLFRRSI